MNGKKRLSIKLGVVLSAFGLVLAACSSSSTTAASAGSNKSNKSAKDVSINVGTTTISWPTSRKPDIAFFAIGSSNAYLVAQTAGAQAAAKAVGAQLTVFNGNFSAQTQLQQVQDALTNPQYNIYVVNPVSPSLECSAFSKDAPAKGIPVAVFVGPLCSKAFALNPTASWQPGTRLFVGGTGQEQAAQAVYSYAQQQNPGAQQVAFFGGPQENGPTVDALDAAKAIQAKHPDFKIIATYYTGYLTATGFSDTQALLSAHPNVSVILSNYVGQTEGIIEALKDAGRTNVKVYDVGGNKYDVSAVENGTVQAFTPYYPYTASYTAVKDIVEVTRGNTNIPRSIGNDGAPKQSFQTGAYAVVTKANVKQFKLPYPW